MNLAMCIFMFEGRALRIIDISLLVSSWFSEL